MTAPNHSSAGTRRKVRTIDASRGPLPPQTADLGHLIDGPVEAMLIGTVMTEGQPAYDQVRSLSVADFGVQRHRVAWRAIEAVANEVQPTIDEIYYQTSSAGTLDSVGGLEYLLEMHRQAIPGIGLKGFAQTLREKSMQRRLWTLNAKLARHLELGSQIDSPEIKSTMEELAALINAPLDGSDTVQSINDLSPVSAAGEAVTYLRNPELPCGAVVGLTGDSGSGKSTLASAWVRDAIGNGIPCLVLDRENPRTVVNDRMQRIGLSDGPMLRWFGGWLGEVPGLDSSVVRVWVEKCDPKPLLVIDSLIAFIGGDENDATVMRAFTHQARKLTDMGATVIVIHHDGKAETARDFRGSSDFKASFDQLFHVSNVGSDSKLDRLRLRCFKSRYGLTESPVYRYAGGQLIRDERPEAMERTVADQLTELLRQNPGAGAKRFEDLAVKKGLGRNRGRDFLSNGVLGGLINRESASRNQHRHWLKEAK